MSAFSIIILIGRPASGKSEIIDYLVHTDLTERQRRFHISKMDVMDDFPMLWVWFEEDHILSTEFGAPRLHTDEAGYFLKDDLWHLLIKRISLDYKKLLRDRPEYHQEHTAIIEFSRGSEHGGYTQALEHLSDVILSKAGIVYVDVPYEESLRKNRRRFNPDRPDSILEHGLEDEKLERLYRFDDWHEFSAGDPEFVSIRGIQVPYVVFENQDDITSGQPNLLGERLEMVLGKLWGIKLSK